MTLTSQISPLLTVITVCLDRVGTIAAALDSVAGQLGADVEHLVVDGGSTDGTLDVVAAYSHVRLISEPDSGVYDAMNKGIRLARGRYVLLLNSDDTLEDGVVAAARPYMSAGYDAICFGTDVRRRGQSGNVEVITTITAPDAIVLSTTNSTLGSPLVNAKMLRRAFLAKVGEFDLRYRLASDVDFLLRVALQNPRLAVLPIIGHHYWEHTGSLTINPTGANGRRAADECMEIADATLARRDLPHKIRGQLKAFRAGKRIAIACRERGTMPRIRAWLRALAGGSDVLRYGGYLLARKCRSGAERLLTQLSSISQSRQDVWLMRHVFAGRRDGTFVEIGAYDGTSYSNCAMMEGVFGWRGVCVEPNPNVFAKLRGSRVADAVNVAVGSRTGTMQFRVAGMLSGLVESYDAVHRKRVECDFGVDTDGNVVEVPVKDLASLLRENALTHIDYMSIDVEGGEREIIAGLASAHVPVTALTVENNYRSRDLRRQVEALGMIKIHELEADDVFVRQGMLSPATVVLLQSRYLLSPGRFLSRVLAPAARRILPDSIAGRLRPAWRWFLTQGHRSRNP